MAFLINETSTNNAHNKLPAIKIKIVESFLRKFFPVAVFIPFKEIDNSMTEKRR